MKFQENWPKGFRGEVVQRCGRTDLGRTDGRTMDDDGRQVITIAHPEPCSGELKRDLMVFVFVVLRMRMRSHQFTLGYRRAFCLKVPHGLYNMFANSKGSSKTELMCRLGLAFGGRLCDKYPFIVCWLLYTSRDPRVYVGGQHRSLFSTL